MKCGVCLGEGWVCEKHSDVAWNDGNGHRIFNTWCGGAGMPCKCNTSIPPWHHIDGRTTQFGDKTTVITKTAIYEISKKGKKR